MTLRQTVGLVGAGAVSRSPVARLLPGALGPVMADSYRLASRLVSSLRAGYPVRDWDELRRSRTILIVAPDSTVPELVRRIAAAPVEWSRRVFLLCDSAQTSAVLTPLAARGAFTGSSAALPGFEPACFLVEGDREALRAARRLIGNPTQAIEVRREAKTRLLAAYAIAGSLFIPLAAVVQSCVRAAGLRGEPANTLVERVFTRALRTFLKSGRQCWTGPRPAPDAAEVARLLAVLQEIDPKLAGFFRGSIVNALELFDRDASGLGLPRQL